MALNGIAVSVKDGDEFKPVIFDDKGEGTDVTIDGDYPLQAYHKNNLTTFQKSTFPSESAETTSMSMIIIARRDKIHLTPEDVLTIFKAKFPLELSHEQRLELKIKSGNITIQSGNVSAKDVFTKEFNTPDFVLDPCQIMIELRYTIECAYGNACINTLCDCK